MGDVQQQLARNDPRVKAAIVADRLVDASYLLPVGDSDYDREQRARLLDAAHRTVERIGVANVGGLVLMLDAAMTGEDEERVAYPDVQGAAYVVEPTTPAAALLGDASLVDDLCGIVMTFELSQKALGTFDVLRAGTEKLVAGSELFEQKLYNLDRALATQRKLAWPPTADGRMAAVIGTTSTSCMFERHDPHDTHGAPHWRLLVRTYDAAASAALKARIAGGATAAEALKEQAPALEASRKLARQLAAFIGAYVQLPEGALDVHAAGAQIGAAEAMNPASVNAYNAFDVLPRQGSDVPYVVFYRRALSTSHNLASGALEFGRTRALGHIAFGGAPWSSPASANAFPMGRPRRYATRAVAYEPQDVEDADAAQRVGFAHRRTTPGTGSTAALQPFSVKLPSRAYADLRDELQNAAFLDIVRRLGWQRNGGSTTTAARIWKTQAAYLSPWKEGRDVQRYDFLLLMRAFKVQYTVTLTRVEYIALLQNDGAQKAHEGQQLFIGERTDGSVELSIERAIALIDYLPQ